MALLLCISLPNLCAILNLPLPFVAMMIGGAGYVWFLSGSTEDLCEDDGVSRMAMSLRIFCVTYHLHPRYSVGSADGSDAVVIVLHMQSNEV